MVKPNLAKVKLEALLTVLEPYGHVVFCNGTDKFLVANLHVLGYQHIVSLDPEVLAPMARGKVPRVRIELAHLHGCSHLQIILSVPEVLERNVGLCIDYLDILHGQIKVALQDERFQNFLLFQQV